MLILTGHLFIQIHENSGGLNAKIVCDYSTYIFIQINQNINYVTTK